MACFKDTPLWMDCLEGLLTASENAFIACVCCEIAGKVYRRHSKLSMKVRRLAEDSMEVNFRQLAEHLRRSVHTRKRFLQKYPRWRQNRNRNISHLKSIADSIDKKRKEVQETQVATSLVSIIGGGLLLFSGAFIPRLLIGAVVGATTIASMKETLDEKNELKENIEKAEEIIKRDRDDLTELLEWVNAADCLKKAMHNFDESIKCDKYIIDAAEKLFEFFEEILKYLNPDRQKEELRKFLKSYCFPPQLAEEISNTVGILLSFFLIFRRFSDVFNLVLDQHALSSVSSDLVRSFYVSMSTYTALSKCSHLVRAMKAKICKGIILDSISLILVASQDPDSAEGKQLRKIADELKEEAKNFEDLYNSMT